MKKAKWIYLRAESNAIFFNHKLSRNADESISGYGQNWVWGVGMSIFRFFMIYELFRFFSACSYNFVVRFDPKVCKWCIQNTQHNTKHTTLLFCQVEHRPIANLHPHVFVCGFFFFPLSERGPVMSDTWLEIGNFPAFKISAFDWLYLKYMSNGGAKNKRYNVMEW